MVLPFPNFWSDIESLDMILNLKTVNRYVVSLKCEVRINGFEKPYSQVYTTFGASTEVQCDGV